MHAMMPILIDKMWGLGGKAGRVLGGAWEGGWGGTGRRLAVRVTAVKWSLSCAEVKLCTYDHVATFLQASLPITNLIGPKEESAGLIG